MSGDRASPSTSTGSGHSSAARSAQRAGRRTNEDGASDGPKPSKAVSAKQSTTSLKRFVYSLDMPEGPQSVTCISLYHFKNLYFILVILNFKSLRASSISR